MARTGKLWHNEAMTETNEISLHLFRVFDFVRKANGWVTANEIAAGAGVAARTSRAHALRLVQAGVFDLAEVFPAHRYRFAATAAKRNRGFLQRLERAEEIFKNA